MARRRIWVMAVIVAGLWLCGGAGIVATARASVLQDLGIEVHGFLDVRGGGRTQDDPHERDASLGEMRAQVDVLRQGDLSVLRLRTDFLYDDVAKDTSLDLDRGIGAIDVREANVLASPLDFADIKIGRQILTWGTGDLLFVNDLFPKDWQAFFAGRDGEYLKAPSDAVFLSLFPGFANIDIAYTPQFDSDRYISGSRLSYWNGMLGRRAGWDAVVEPDTPDAWFEDDELAVRASKNVGGYELAAYGYAGFWKSPMGFNPDTMAFSFPALSVYGASARGVLGKGLVSVEFGHYESEDDSDGRDPFVPNSEDRAFVGYEREVLRDFSAGIQYYVEHMEDHDDYRASLPEGQEARAEDRHVVTLRLTRRAWSQNLVLSLFAMGSPSDKDLYLRPVITYSVTDDWLVTVGGNVFVGEAPYTFLGQFEKNSNAYAAVRYSY